MPYFVNPAQRGSALDATARFYLPMLPDPADGLFGWSGIETQPGDLTLELNQGSGNGPAHAWRLGLSALVARFDR